MFSNIYTLYLSNNSIKDISPIASLKNLSCLDLSNNDLTDIDSFKNFNMSFIYSINLSDNKIKDVSLLNESRCGNDLFEKFDPDRFGPHLIAMAHGEADTVIDPQEALRFARKFSIPITVFEAEAHSLSLRPETPDKVADLAIALYQCEEGKS